MRYVTPTSQCKKSEVKVTIKPGPVLTCVQPDGTVRKVSSFTTDGAPTAVSLTPTPLTPKPAKNVATGALAELTASGAGFSATGGGTVTVQTGTNANTIDTTTGTALNVANTTIGSNGLTFRSIAANGAANGIVLNGTGSNGLTVTGDSTLARNGSGEPSKSEIRIMSFVFAPKGWALCNGQLLPINQNQMLCSLPGTTFRAKAGNNGAPVTLGPVALNFNTPSNPPLPGNSYTPRQSTPKRNSSALCEKSDLRWSLSENRCNPQGAA
jgi:hypothetical protein